MSGLKYCRPVTCQSEILSAISPCCLSSDITNLLLSRCDLMRCQSLHVLLSTGLIGFAFVIASTASAQVPARDLRKTALKSATPSDEIIRIDIDHDGRPDIIERWWNGKRVRWLDENGDMLPTDTRGDQVADVLQVD